MKIKKPKRIMSLFLAALMCVTSLVGIGTTAYAAEETDDVYLISYPRDGDSNYNAEWGHGSLTFMNGWKTGTSRYTTVRAMGSYNGNICYCIEIGVPQQTGDSFTKKGEDFWDNYPSSYNSTISPDDIKLFIGRIFQYGYTGTISTSWRSQNEGGDKLAHAVATQLLIWETVIGERDENFNKVSTGGKDAVLDQISPNHPLYDKIMSYYNSMAASVQKHSKLPSFLTKTPGSAQEIELEWDGSKYTVTLTDSNNVLSGYKFSSNDSGVQFSVSGNKLTITAEKAPSDGLTITAEKTAQRKGVITWTDGIYGPNGGVQDTVTYAQTVNDPVKGFLKLKVSYGSAKIVKTSEDGKVDGISFRIQGNGIDKTVKTENGGQIQVDTVYDVNISENEQVVEIEIVNELVRGNIALTKVDAEYTDTKLTGAVFEVYKDSNDNGELDSEDELIGTLTEKEIGQYEMNDLLYGRYFILESASPDSYIRDEGVYEVFIDTDGKTYQVENTEGKGFANEPMRGNLKIVKTSSDGKVEGFAFRITGANGYDVTLETDENGEIFLEGLRIGEYKISEVNNSASAMYILPADKEAAVQTGSTTVVEMHNELRDTPKTGDDSKLGLWLALAGVSAAGIAACGIIGFKKKKKKEDN